MDNHKIVLVGVGGGGVIGSAHIVCLCLENDNICIDVKFQFHCIKTEEVV